MIWRDIVLQHPLKDREIVTGLAAAFGIGSDDVLVHRGTDDFPDPLDAKVVCIAVDRTEGFRIVLSLYTYFDPPREVDPVAVVRDFARATQTECLLPDDSPDPYTMIQVFPSGEVARVKLDVDRMDDRGEYHITEDSHRL